jgi:hypothetical protein
MGATAWAFYHEAKHKLCVGDTSGFNLSADIFKLELYMTAATKPADLQTLSIASEISIECSGGAYVAGGKTLSATTWTVSSVSIQKFDSTNWIMTATGSTISGVRFGVIRNSIGATSGFLLCFSQLSDSAFDVTTGNTLTIQINANGIFNLQ